MLRKFLLFIIFLIPLGFMFFQLQILGHELYHFIENSPYSTAICIDQDLRTDIVAFTISDAGENYKIFAKDSSSSTTKTFLFYDTNEELTADLVGYIIALGGTIIILALFYAVIKKI